MYFVGLGTATPKQCYSQRECWRALQTSQPVAGLTSRSRAILKKVLCGENGIATRYLAVATLEEALDLTPDTLHARYARHAPALALAAARVALRDAEVEPHSLDAILISTCTGYLCPGLTSYVSEQLGLRTDVFALDLVGQGCGAALPNLRTAEALLAAGRAEKVLSVCVEICSAAAYLDDDPGVLISACLFGDGAGAAVLARQPIPGRRGVQWKAVASRHVPAERETLRFEQRGGMLRNVLARDVPRRAAEHVRELFDEALKMAGLTRAAVAGWVLHTGGRDVLLALKEQLNLSDADVRHSTTVLRDFGNVSSPTVFFVLERALADQVPNGLWWMSSFGAGFSCHGALLEVRAAGSPEISHAPLC